MILLSYASISLLRCLSGLNGVERRGRLDTSRRIVSTHLCRLLESDLWSRRFAFWKWLSLILCRIFAVFIIIHLQHFDIISIKVPTTSTNTEHQIYSFSCTWLIMDIAFCEASFDGVAAADNSLHCRDREEERNSTTGDLFHEVADHDRSQWTAR